ncbi:DUF2130 domain-containing protein [Fructobacillus sp. M1-13]|uniref:DUF2130 domain-containing protein n=1 Tax=Fructobacillus papyriferae TaxID=2713171 RepID=A0ABS5QNX2_9LACO|nr:DUF2130 domain-containing protein [Fructobacillus papyriferae]MBS9334751.1 DUF2130 domain-containing protein [Fructobacillus papyriferae]MCD2158741.1 DUF2130 domain-containing protein [Fructobacillus papyriferae]
MAKLKYSVQSETVLVLQEDGQKGDTLDLKDEQKVDASSLSQTVLDQINQRIHEEKAVWEKHQQQLLASKVAQEKEAARFDIEKASQKAKDEAQQTQAKLQEELAQLKAELSAQKKQNDSDQALALSKQKAELTTAQQSEKEALKEAQQKERDTLQKEFQEKQEAAAKTQQSLEKQVFELQNQVQNQDRDRELALTKVKADYDAQLKAAEEKVEFYKDFKARQSTKEIGESLEVYAHQEFDKIRPYAFPNAYFEKDNDVSKETGSKGDFIFRDYEDGVEFISIMFDMKNEADSTEKKHRNADFFKELDKDRREKGTEYAVLVSLLEADNDLYNTGIVQVHGYEKMYVIRPQFFVHFIGLLKNAALDSVQYKKELAEAKEQNIDITNFEDNINSFKDKFAKNYVSYSNNFQQAIEEIDKAIRRMEEVKKKLTTSENQLRLANNKLDDLSVKKLTRGNPTMKTKFDALKKEKD